MLGLKNAMASAQPSPWLAEHTTCFKGLSFPSGESIYKCTTSIQGTCGPPYTEDGWVTGTCKNGLVF